MNPILITSTDESTGKTAIALALALSARERGDSVGYMKPKGTRLQSAVGKTLDEDPLLARELLELDADIADLEPVVYSRTFVEQTMRGREDPDELHDQVRESYDRLADGTDVMVLEGGGTFAAGGAAALTDADVAELLDARAVLVATYADPTDVDDVLSAARHLGDRLAGVVFNGVADADLDALVEDAIPFLEGRGIRVFGALPRVQELAGVTVSDLADELGAEVLTTDAPTDAFVERFTVGAMSAEDARKQFRRTRAAAMITGGDRPEITTAALDAPGIEAVLLTGGFHPPAAVLGRAEDAGVPVLLTRSDTITTVDRAEDVVRSGRARNAATVERMHDLLEEDLDVEALLELSGE
ncbi:phosphotransacetylase family protein [Halomarina oriensis]|uniref:AAA family ATPase n=1 Tax=Halomarina oriensis TaxID=671145 RepID=A0A6B0GI31_9EURY|nr:phosphotransacetylase family protein [Halomarina oriensis]MWG33089.1 AAA family ATPase [Halomarina oriensis]